VSAGALARAPMLALANAVLLTIGSASHADEVEAIPAPPRVLLSSDLPLVSPLDEDRFAPQFGIRKGRGFQVVKPIEMNDRKYEFNVSGPVVKSGSKKKSVGLNFEIRF
jgi:hypothetical protein